MTTCAVLLVKDEADVIEPVLRHLAYHVDEIIVADNLSADATPVIVLRLLAEGFPIRFETDNEPGYYQARKMTALAQRALELGHEWVIPCDADEVWHVGHPATRPIREFLAGLAPDVQIVQAELYNHLPTALDPPAACPSCEGTAVVAGPDWPCPACGGSVEPNPFLRIGWRQRHHGALPKVACRLRPDLEILAGNHDARTSGTALRSHGLIVRHFSWRSAEQYVRKIRNGALAYAATDLPESTGAHWRMHGDPADPSFDERVANHYRQWFRSERPNEDESLIYDPAPLQDDRPHLP